MSWGIWKFQVELGVYKGQADLKASRRGQAKLEIHEGQADLRACGEGSG